MRASLFVTAAALLLSPTWAQAEAHQHGAPGHAPTMVVDVDRAPNASSVLPSKTLYLNGCFGGCSVTPGYDDSRINSSSLVNQASSLAPFSYGQETWDEIVSCVADIYAPFGITVTDREPGDTPHFEVMVAGSPGDLGYPAELGGVAPFNCDVVDNAITFVFPSKLLGKAASICQTIAHESAHPWGLEHEYLCEDPMTYLDGCGAKTFQDTEAQCGEDSARPCRCGGQTQNSYKMLLERFGPNDATPPQVDISSPRPGQQVDRGFVIEVDASDDTAISRVDLLINGNMIARIEQAPYRFTAPSDLRDGSTTVEVVAYDNQLAATSALIEVMVGEPCAGSSDCGGGDTCVEGRCVLGPGSPGGLGETCDSGGQCDSGLCIAATSGYKVCAEPCTPGGSSCPGGFVCTKAGFGSSVCFPGDSGGCSVGPRPESPTTLPWLIALFGIALLGRRRRFS